VIGKKEVIQQNYPILLGTLPYKTVQIGSEFVIVPDNLREAMSFSIPDPTGASMGLTYTTGMPQIAGKKITLSFSPATANDQTIIESLLPVPHTDGTPIQPSELPSSFPAYLINLKPELRIDGQVVAIGSSVTMGSAQPFTMSLNEPGNGISNIDNIAKAGEYYSIGIDTGRIGADRLNALKSKLAATKAKLEAQNYIGLTKDDIVGDLLSATIVAYLYALDANDEMVAKMQGVIRYRVPSVGMYSFHLDVQDVFGIPMKAASKSMMMDVDRLMQTVFSKDGNVDKVKQYMLTSGSVSSASENILPEQMYSTTGNKVQGISTLKALQMANSQGIPIYTIDQTNIATVLPQLQIDDEVKNDIANAVNAGKKVIVSKSNITLNGWTGCGYLIIDPVTGAGAYMISGGQSGGIILCYIGMFLTTLGVNVSGEIGNTLVNYGQTLMFLGATIIIDNAVPAPPVCSTSPNACLQHCMGIVNPFWPATIAGFIGLTSQAPIFASLQLSLASSIIFNGLTLASLGMALAVIGAAEGGLFVGGFIGCSAVCLCDPCSYDFLN
jgi:hypothetical protein